MIRKLEILEYNLDCSNNQLQELVIGSTCLHFLDCRNNKLTQIYTRGFYEMEEFMSDQGVEVRIMVM